MPSSSSSSSSLGQFTALIAASATAAAIVSAMVFEAKKSSRHGWKQGLPITSSNHDNLKRCPYYKELTVAMKLAHLAGQNMTTYLEEKGTAAESRHDLGINAKGQAENFYTKIDVENERLVMDGLQREFPTQFIIGEETCGMGKIPPIKKDVPTWIIDPIDGTTNFANGLPLTCVSIGLCVDGVPTVGVAYAPMMREWYIGIKGYGSYRNGVKIAPRKPKILNESLVCFELGYPKVQPDIDILLNAIKGVLESGCKASRQIGSGVLDLCYVATGRLDVVYAGVANEGWKPWDYCAGVVIAEEAGCVTESIDQKEAGPYDLYSKSIICANSASLVQEVREAVRKHL